ncbi:hypothetical protein ACHWQZ_G016131 [Mnemiopsis leidyi]
MRVAVYGGKGALGSTLVNHFKSKDWWVCSIDLRENPEADVNVVVKGATLEEQAAHVNKEVATLVTEKLDALYCVAGGWAGGDASHENFIKNTDLMMKQSIWTSVISANVAAKHLKEGGLLTLTGAEPCLEGTHFMIGYGLSKAAVHQLTASLAQKGGGLPEGAVVQCILPKTLDTPMNRKFMANADFTTRTPMSYISEMFTKWTEDPSSRHPNGALVKILTENSETKETVV